MTKQQPVSNTNDLIHHIVPPFVSHPFRSIPLHSINFQPFTSRVYPALPVLSLLIPLTSHPCPSLCFPPFSILSFPHIHLLFPPLPLPKSFHYSSPTPFIPILSFLHFSSLLLFSSPTTTTSTASLVPYHLSK